MLKCNVFVWIEQLFAEVTTLSQFEAERKGPIETHIHDLTMEPISDMHQNLHTPAGTGKASAHSPGFLRPNHMRLQYESLYHNTKSESFI